MFLIITLKGLTCLTHHHPCLLTSMDTSRREPSSRVTRARAGFPCEDELDLGLLLVGVSGSAGADGLISAGILDWGTWLRQRQLGVGCKNVKTLVNCTGFQLNGRKCPLRGVMCPSVCVCVCVGAFRSLDVCSLGIKHNINFLNLPGATAQINSAHTHLSTGPSARMCTTPPSPFADGYDVTSCNCVLTSKEL